MSEQKTFNIGNRVRLKSNGKIVEVVIVKDGWIAYDENRRIAGSCPMAEVEPVDPKTAFLSELKGLLEKYDACINVGWNDGWQSDDREYPLIDMCIQLGNNPYAIAFDDVLNKSLTADTIMDYDKE